MFAGRGGGIPQIVPLREFARLITPICQALLDSAGVMVYESLNDRTRQNLFYHFRAAHDRGRRDRLRQSGEHAVARRRLDFRHSPARRGVFDAWPTDLGLAVGAITSLLLAGKFIPDFIKTGQAMPAGMMSVLSVIGFIMAILAWMKK